MNKSVSSYSNISYTQKKKLLSVAGGEGLNKRIKMREECFLITNFEAETNLNY
jgi:hypothetical protein